MRSLGICALLVIAAVIAGCDDDDYEPMGIRTLGFSDGEEMPSQHTCHGEGLSPPLTFNQIPEGTKSLAVTMEDTDRLLDNYVHWVLWGLGPNQPVPENTEENLPENATQGLADDGVTTGYLAPCPSPGDPHRFIFKVFALDTEITLKKGATRNQLKKKMDGHILGYGELKGIVTPE